MTYNAEYLRRMGLDIQMPNFSTMPICIKYGVGRWFFLKFKNIKMDIKSLRKGSVVKYDKKTAYIAQVLMDIGVVIYDGYGLEKMTTTDCLRDHEIDEVHLLKMGFQYKTKNRLVSYEKEWGDYTIEIQPRISLPKYTFWINGLNLKQINCIHELQGLFFEITGVFLTI